MDHLALEHPRFSPTNRSSDDMDREGAMSAAALPPASMYMPGPPAWPPAGEGTLPGMRSRSKQESMNARLAAGEYPWDMISLKAAIQAARPGDAGIQSQTSRVCMLILSYNRRQCQISKNSLHGKPCFPAVRQLQGAQWVLLN